MQRILEGVMVVYFAEVAAVLIVAPWTNYWDRNYFVETLPFAQPLLTSHAGRGAIVGVGVVALGASLTELVRAIHGARRRRAARRNYTLLPGAVPPPRMP